MVFHYLMQPFVDALDGYGHNLRARNFSQHSKGEWKTKGNANQKAIAKKKQQKQSRKRNRK